MDSETIRSYTNTKYKDIIIPDQIGSNGVSAIAREAFKGKNLTAVTFPETISNIGEEAFANNQITSVSLHNRYAASIGKNAFANNRITMLTLPQKVFEIDPGAFNNNAITSINGAASNGIIYARRPGASLSDPPVADNTTIVSYGGASKTIDFIPSNVTTIGESAFANSALTTLALPNSVTTIGKNAFRGNQLTTLTFPNSLTTIGDYAFDSNQLTTLTFSNNLTNIGTFAFRGNQLTTLTFPNSLTTIGDYAFDSNQLTTLTLPNSVTTIGISAFNNNAITRVNNQVSKGIIYARNTNGTENKTKIVSYGGVATAIDFIPNRVTTIAESAFEGNNLTRVTFPSNSQLLSVGYNAFEDNASLGSVTLPSGSNSAYTNAGAWQDDDNSNSTLTNGELSAANFENAYTLQSNNGGFLILDPSQKSSTTLEFRDAQK